MFKKRKNAEEDTLSLAEKMGDYEFERGDIQAHNSMRAKRKIRLLFISLVGLGSIFLFLFSIMSLSKEPEEIPVQTPEVSSQSPRSNFSQEMDRLLQFSQRQALQSKEEKPEEKATPTVEPSLPVATVSALEPSPDELRRLSGAVTVDFSSTSSVAKDPVHSAEESTTLLNDKMVRSSTPSTRALRRQDLSYLLRKGTTIGCTLQTKIITTQPGFTRCVVNKDVYSADGKLLLIERGSEVIGEQTAGLAQGQSRIFVMWNTIETPKGVQIEVNSPTSDTLGASGQEAQVDTHFRERFGGAILLSMIDDVMGIASQQVSNRNYQFSNTQDNVQSMAEEALRNTINIPPTGYVNQGSVLTIIVARDVDFTGVYELVRLR